MAREEVVGQIHHYNIACNFAVSSATAGNDGKLTAADRTRLKALYADSALDSRQAVAEGTRTPLCSKTIRTLRSLRSREDIQKLVREVERKSRK